MTKTKNLLFILIIFVGLFVVFYHASAQENTTRTRIDESTIIKGYTVVHNDIRFAVTPNQVDQKVHVTLKDINIDEKSLPAGKKIISNAYSFDMIGLKYNPIIVKKPSWLAVKYNSNNDNKKSLYYWDNNKNSWVELPSYADKSSGCVRAITHLSYSKIVVLEDIKPEEKYEGLASWYYNGEEMTAAMNHFTIGDKVKIINKVNNKSCVVTVIDRGSFAKGIMIDLSDDAFSAIGLLSDGLLEVKVEGY